jgi:DNA primase
VIKRETIDRIFETARIEEVIGEFVNLKRAGSNFKGLSPFVDERTPSFMVSPSKQIFKDFSSGKGGSVVTFLMEHEQMSYPEALRFLADRYNIDIEEEETTPEQEEAKSHRESLYIVLDWMEKYFVHNLNETNEGRSVGLSYFKERGFTDETIEAFRLGYAMDSSDDVVSRAQEQGHKREFLLELGLIKDSGKGLFDGFRGRVMFPIHNLSGRTLGFGGRTLQTDKKVAKYINSPENEIYHKSKIVYGIYQAKKYIVKEDLCFLVEGYTDVLAMHQAGIRNVVASSGTALTNEQVRLIGRYTKNITILYDSDSAGIKASFRGIDIILAEGLNVKVALLPKGEDPDSFAKTRDEDEIREYFSEAVKDFILFKTQLLAEESAHDPVKKAGLVRSIIETISLIPDGITRSVYTKECSTLLEIPERTLLLELNKIRVKSKKDQLRKDGVPDGTEVSPDTSIPAEIKQEEYSPYNTYYQERDILRLILNYGMSDIDVYDAQGNLFEEKWNLSEFVDEELKVDNLGFEDAFFKKVFDLYFLERSKNSETDPVKQLTNHSENEIRELVADLIAEKYHLHNWSKQKIEVQDEGQKLFRAVRDSIYAFKARKINKTIEHKRTILRQLSIDSEELMPLMVELQKLDEIRRSLLTEQGITIFK